MSDPLASWWRHEVTLERLSGGDGDGYGNTFDAAEVLLGYVHDGNTLVRAANGDQVVSSTQVALPIGVGYVRPRSRVTLPATFGSRVTTVISCEVGDGGGQPTPDHVRLLLE